MFETGVVGSFLPVCASVSLPPYQVPFYDCDWEEPIECAAPSCAIRDSHVRTTWLHPGGKTSYPDETDFPASTPPRILRLATIFTAIYYGRVNSAIASSSLI